MESSSIGGIICVESWNFPYYQLARVAGPHLIAGNVLVIKHAGCVPQCAIEFEKLWIDAGAPVGLYTNLRICHAQSDRVIDDMRIAGVALTGSVAAGRSIAARAGQALKPTSMELEGGVVAIHAIHLDRMPEFDYDKFLWGERQIRSVANMTREDARDFLELAHRLKIRPRVSVFPLEQAQAALLAVKEETEHGSAVIVP